MLACSAGPRRRLIAEVIAPARSGAEVARRELDRVREHQAHDVARPHSEVEERGGEPVGRAVEPAEVDTLVLVDVRLAAGVVGRGRTEEVGQQRRRHRGERYRVR